MARPKDWDLTVLTSGFRFCGSPQGRDIWQCLGTFLVMPKWFACVCVCVCVCVRARVLLASGKLMSLSMGAQIGQAPSTIRIIWSKYQ